VTHGRGVSVPALAGWAKLWRASGTGAVRLIKEAADAGEFGGPVEVQGPAAEHVEGDGTKLGDAAIKTVFEIVADDEVVLFRDCGWKEGGVIGRLGFRPRRNGARCGRAERPAVDEESAVGTGRDKVAGQTDGFVIGSGRPRRRKPKPTEN
jgi:hypothetical protein